MMLTTKGRYAVMAILEIASLSNLKPVKLQEVSERQDIPLNYLEQIFARLKKAQLVSSVKGPGGGYIINTQLSKLKIANIIDAVEENIEMTRCSKKTLKGCKADKSRCMSHNLWQGLGDQIRNYLETISIEDVIAGNHDLSRS